VRTLEIKLRKLALRGLAGAFAPSNAWRYAAFDAPNEAMAMQQRPTPSEFGYRLCGAWFVVICIAALIGIEHAERVAAIAGAIAWLIYVAYRRHFERTSQRDERRGL
jgi:hypothetical protein